MRNVLIDTNIYTSFKAKDLRIIEAFHHLDFIGIDITVLGELYAGFSYGTKEQKNRQELEEFLNNRRVHIIDHTCTTAEFYAKIYRNLRKRGKPVPTNDMWIASVAMQHGLFLFSMDNHFQKIEGLMLKTDF